jgi:hypothetical protein
MDWLLDSDLFPHERRLLREFGSPRSGLDGRLYWAVDELPRWIRSYTPPASLRATVATATGVP